MKTRFAANVDSCLENFLDCPHTVFVHKGWFRNHDTRELTARVRSGTDFAGVEFAGEPLSNSVISRLFFPRGKEQTDRKSTRLNSSHQIISYAAFCLKTKIT